MRMSLMKRNSNMQILEVICLFSRSSRLALRNSNFHTLYWIIFCFEQCPLNWKPRKSDLLNLHICEKINENRFYWRNMANDICLYFINFWGYFAVLRVIARPTFHLFEADRSQPAQYWGRNRSVSHLCVAVLPNDSRWLKGAKMWQPCTGVSQYSKCYQLFEKATEVEYSELTKALRCHNAKYYKVHLTTVLRTREENC